MDEFSSLMLEDKYLNEFTLARFARDAQAEVRNDPVPAYTLLGAIASCRLDVEDLKRFHAKVLACADDDVARMNYAISLRNAGLFREAAEQLVVAVERYPEVVSTLEMAIDFSWTAGMLDKAEELSLRALKMNMMPSDKSEPIVNAKKVLERKDVCLSSYERSIDIALSILRSANLRADGTSIDIDTDSGDESILYQIGVRADDAAIESVQDRLGEALCDQLGEKWRPEVLMFEYFSVQ